MAIHRVAIRSCVVAGLSARKVKLSSLAFIVALLVFGVAGSAAHAEGQSIYHVSVATGADSARCGGADNPCKSIQYVINNRTHASGDIILVAMGAYRYQGDQDGNACARYLAARAVVCIVNKQVTIRGGYSLDWSTNAPARFPTVIDGEGRVRGVYMQSPDKSYPSTSGLEMEGITIRNGFTRCADSQSGAETCAFGGGMLTDYAALSLRNMRFEANRVEGNNARVGGSASGGGLAIRVAVGTATIENSVFVRNTAKAGNGSTRGGYSVGGGLYILYSAVNGNNLEFYENQSLSGDSSGDGTYNGEIGDAFGAAATIMGDSTVTLRNAIAHNNLTQGGRGYHSAGGAFGGAFKAEGTPWRDEPVTFTLINADVRNNTARGGNILGTSTTDGSTGGLSAGGGLEAIHANVYIYHSRFIDNSSISGNGGQRQGGAGGGALYLQNIGDGSAEAVVRNTVIVNNHVRLGRGGIQGGGGGGIWLQGIKATLAHNTIAGNEFQSIPLQGAGILVMADGVNSGPQPATIEYNIIANNGGEGETVALHTKLRNTANLNQNLFAGNEADLNTWEVGTVNGMGTSILANDAMFVAPGAPDYDYRISSLSLAVDAATRSAETVDFFYAPRIGVPDIGAAEARSFAPVLVSGDTALRVYWGNNPGARSYVITVSCRPAANAPNEVACANSLNVAGNRTEQWLTGLSNYVPYQVTIAANVVGRTTPVVGVASAIPTDLRVYMPVTTKP